MGAMADQAGAEQRRRLDVGVFLRQTKAEPRVGDRIVLVATVDVATGEPCVVAEVFESVAAKPAATAGGAEQGTPTRSPTSKPVTPPPGWSTVPTISWPGTIG
jgi:hypothetical protein